MERDPKSVIIVSKIFRNEKLKLNQYITCCALRMITDEYMINNDSIFLERFRRHFARLLWQMILAGIRCSFIFKRFPFYPDLLYFMYFGKIMIMLKIFLPKLCDSCSLYDRPGDEFHNKVWQI